MKASWASIAPTDDQVRSMLTIMQHRLGTTALADGLGTSNNMLYWWLDGTRAPGDSTRKLVWITYSLLFQRERLATWFDVVTWGKFAHDLSTRPEGMPDRYAKVRRQGRQRKKDKKGRFVSKAVKYQAFDAGI